MSMQRHATVAALLALALVASACRGGDDDAATTTTADPDVTTSILVTPSEETSGTVAGSESGDTSTTSTTQVIGGTPTYEVAQRTEGDLGDELIVVVEPGSYTEVELQNLVFDIVDRFQPLSAVVVDDPAAVALLSADTLSAEDEDFLAGHTFFSLTDGVDVTFSGPYSQIADLTIGS